MYMFFIWNKINISELVEAPAKIKRDAGNVDMDDAGDMDDETPTGYGSTYVFEISDFLVCIWAMSIVILVGFQSGSLRKDRAEFGHSGAHKQ